MISIRQKVALSLFLLTVALFSILLLLSGTGPTVADEQNRLFLPLVDKGIPPTPTVTPTPSPPPLPPPLAPPTAVAGQPPLNFPTIRAELQAQGLDLAFNKIGFHMGAGGQQAIWQDVEQMMIDLDAAGVPFFIKSASNAEPIFVAQQLMAQSGVPHILVYRSVTPHDVPLYHLSPAEAAKIHWEAHRTAFPPELDPGQVWLETMNEVDKNRSEWLGNFSLEVARLAMADGFRWAAFGWSSGEPEPEQWEGPAMLSFLRLAGNHPDQLAIALHEYSYTTDSIGRIYPYLVGRFQKLFMAADRHGIPRPTVLVTEWGWEYRTIPTVAEALADIAWAAWLYAAYPQVQGAAIWYLGPGFGDIDSQARQLIAPMMAYSLSHYFIIDPGFGAIDADLFAPNPPTALRK